MIRLLALLLFLPQSQTVLPNQVTWEYGVIATPDIVGPFVGDDPAFKGPVAINVNRPAKPASRASMTLLGLEASIDTTGHTHVTEVRWAESREGEVAVRKIVNTWLFQPARFQGKPIRVSIAVDVTDRRPHPH